MNFKVL